MRQLVMLFFLVRNLLCFLSLSSSQQPATNVFVLIIFFLTAAFVLLFIAEILRSERRKLYGKSTVIMSGENPILPGLINKTGGFSPITMNDEWSRLARLVVLVLVSCYAATINSYFISSFIVVPCLRRAANVFLACLGFADMMMSGLIILAAAVLLSGEWDTVPICHAIQTTAVCSTYCYSLYFPLYTSATYFKLCHSCSIYKKQRSVCIALLAVLVFVISLSLATIGTYMEFDYDYCQRQHTGNIFFRLYTSVLVQGTSFLFTIYTLALSFIQVNRFLDVKPRQRRPHGLWSQKKMIWLNIKAYGLYVGFWLPYLIVVNLFPDATDSVYYPAAWLGISRGIVTNTMYGACNSTFRRAYVSLFKYCYCKSSMNTYQRRPRKRNGQVRIHVMQRAVNTYRQQHATSWLRETVEL